MYLEISKPMDYRVGLYIRLSKEDDREGQSESVSNQLSMLRDFTKERRLDVYDTYIDDGWSGTNFDRPGFNRLIADIEAKKVNMVITKDLSRLGRDYIMTGHYMARYFPEHRVRYISLLDGIDTGVDSTANDITTFRAIMNDRYAKDILIPAPIPACGAVSAFPTCCKTRPISAIWCRAAAGRSAINPKSASGKTHRIG